MRTSNKPEKSRKVAKLKPAVPYQRKPLELSLEGWQAALRKQYAEQHTFGIENLGDDPVFSDFRVHSPESGKSYKVSIRDNRHSFHFCSCYDFRTNGLGTCKHLEAVLHRIRINPRLSKLYQRNFRPEYTSVYLSYPEQRKVKIRIGSLQEEKFRKLASGYFDREGSLKPEMASEFETFLNKAAKVDESFRCYPDALAHILEIRAAEVRTKLVEQHYLPFIDNGKFDSILNAKLFRYQKEGICFALKAGRSLLADDMGLGKTIQALGVAEVMKKEKQILSVLIVCPTSLKYQWKSEIEKFTGSSVTVVEGLPQRRWEQYRRDEFYKIVSYHALVNDLKEIGEMQPDLVILDEAQRIKNFKAKVSQAVKSVVSPYALVLTGTPLENRLEELYSVIQFVDPFKLGPFYRFLHDHQVTDSKGKVTGYRDLNSIGQLLADVMLRRKRSEVLSQLPSRMDKQLFVPMSDEQRRIHDELGNLVARLVFRWRKTGHLSEQERQRLLILLNQMRMVCDSTYILDQKTRHDTKVEEVMNIIGEVMSEGAEKVVIFSQWERMTRLVAQELENEGIGYEYLHGGVPGNHRGELFTRFREDPSKRVFLSTDAGGVGLNLQTASILINLDIPWNPAVLEQRIGRVHRMGQKRNVSVINMVAAQTIEHRMLSVLAFKSSMAAGILDGGDDAIFLGESRFNKFMETVGELVEQPENTDQGVVVSVAETQEENPSPGIQDTENNRLPGDEIIAGTDAAETKTSPKSPEISQEDPQHLLRKGLEFFSGLAEALSNPETTRQMVDSIVTTDPKDGKTYLKLPVENRTAVENIFNLVGSLFQALRKQ